MDFEKVLNEEIENICRVYLKNFDYVETYLKFPGKRMRPKLYLEYVETKRPLEEKDYRIAAAIELLHLFFLVHDDIMDDDTLRRGEKTIHAYYAEKFGEVKGRGIGIVVGDLIFSRSMNLFRKYLKNDDALKRVYEVVDITAQGQLDEYLATPANPMSLSDCLSYYGEKTAFYSIYLPLALGYIMGGFNDTDGLAKIRLFSSDLGTAFQVNDDLIEFNLEKLRSEEKVCRDVMRGKVTPILILILEKSDDKEKWLKEWANGELSKESHDQILARGKEIGVIENMREKIDIYLKMAWRNAEGLGLENLPTVVLLKKMLHS